MATRQYIGARYVPKIFNNNGSNEWVSGIAYEPLTIVTYLNNSYTSSKPVPSNAGAPNVATEYWACTGNVVELINDAVTELEHEINGVASDVTAVSNKVTEISKHNQSIPTKVLCVGDSYGTIGTNNWTKYLKDYLGLDDAHFVNKCTGSSGFVGNASVPNFLSQLEGVTDDKSTYTT